MIQNPNISIRRYEETDFERIAQIHDFARQNERALNESFGFRIKETISGKMPGDETFQMPVHVMKKL